LETRRCITAPYYNIVFRNTILDCGNPVNELRWKGSARGAENRSWRGLQESALPAARAGRDEFS
jgi:hypothetical protein